MSARAVDWLVIVGLLLLCVVCLVLMVIGAVRVAEAIL